MTLGKTLLLGLIAGGTIVLGLPLGRMRRPAPQLRAFLNAVAVGILVFLVWDVLSHAWEPVDSSLVAFHRGTGSLGPAFGYGGLFIGGLSVGLLSLVGYESWMSRRTRRPPSDGKPVTSAGPGAMAVNDTVRGAKGMAAWSAARRLSLLIAVGIGLHNFAEGLAIGQSAASGEIALAVLLVIGFALHNATEGFGIVAPLAADLDESGRRNLPSWGFLLSMALIGGGPTFLGTWIGHGFTSEALSVVFLTLAAGSIIYVVIQLIGVATRSGYRTLLCYGLLLGLVAGFVTDAIVTAGGA
jgi:ZIP family zinc transporter